MKVKVTSEELRLLKSDLAAYHNLADSKSKELLKMIGGCSSYVNCKHTETILSGAALVDDKLSEALRHLRMQIDKLDDIARDYEETEMNNIDRAQLLG